MNQSVRRFWTTVALIALAGCKPPVVPESEVKVFQQEQPRWRALDIPRAEIILPSFFVGEQGALSSGCWHPAPMTTTAAADSVEMEQERTGQVAANVRAKFASYLAKAGLELELAQAFTQRWTLDMDGISHVSVDAAQIRPNFMNQSCRTEALDWFEDGKFVVTEAIKAEKVSIFSGSEATNEEKLKLDVAIQKINTEFGVNFQNIASASGTLKIEASSAFVGTVGTVLAAVSCNVTRPIALEVETTVELCGGDYSLDIRSSSVGNRYTIAVTPRDGETAAFDEEYGIQRVRPLDEVRILRAKVSRKGDGIVLDQFNVLLVGAKG